MDPISIDVTEIIHFDITAHENIIFVRDSCDEYYYNTDTKVLKHVKAEDPLSTIAGSLRFFRGKIIGMCHFPEDGFINFFEMNMTDGSWKHLSRVPMPELTLEDQDWFHYYTARHLIHDNEFFIEIPPRPDKEENYYQYRNVDFESNCLGNYVLEFHNGLLIGKDFLSLPSWILH